MRGRLPEQFGPYLLAASEILPPHICLLLSDDELAVVGLLVVRTLRKLRNQMHDKHGELIKDGLAFARANGKTLGRPRVPVDISKITILRKAGCSWPQIAKQLGVGVGTAFRAGKSGGIS